MYLYLDLYSRRICLYEHVQIMLYILSMMYVHVECTSGHSYITSLGLFNNNGTDMIVYMAILCMWSMVTSILYSWYIK